MSSISLTASMRSNLLSLKATSTLMSTTQDRLSSGKKVNSAIDNPSSFYTAQSLNNRANDLSGLLDSMGQAISTIKAANQGIESITSFLEQAKAVATSALSDTDISSRKEYGTQFNDILKQIDAMASDSDYKGVNLLKGDKLTVTFNEGRTNTLKIEGVNADFATLGLSVQDWDVSKDAGVITKKGQYETAAAQYEAVKANGIDVGAAVEGAAGADASHIHTAEKVAAGTSKVFAVGDKFYQITAETEVAAGEVEIGTGAGKAVLLTKSEDGKYYVSADEAGKAGAMNTAKAAYDAEVKAKNTALSTTIQTAIDKAVDAIGKMRQFASTFGNNYSIVQTREEFTSNLINVLEEGADKLTLADMNEESANMLALQTRQQLAINSLSLASQASQSILKLF